MVKYYKSTDQMNPISIDTIKMYITLAPDEDSRMVIACVWLTGGRISEIVNLKMSNIFLNLEERDIEFMYDALKHGKKAHPSFNFDDPFIESLVVPYFKSLGVVEYRKGNIPDSKIFSRGKRRYEQIMKKLNEHIHGNDTSKWIVFHELRHGRITFLARNRKATQEEMQSWTGHRTGIFMDYIATRKVDRFKGTIG